MYAYAGQDSYATDNDIRYYNDTYKLDLLTLTWSKINTSVSYENRYYSGGGIIDNKLVLLFGWSDYLNGDCQDIATLDLLNPLQWVSTATDPSCPVQDSYSFVTINSSIYYFAGYQNGVYVNNMVEMTNMKCTLINDVYSSPPARMYNSLEAMNSKIYLFGGTGISGLLGDMWVFDLQTQVWSEIPDSNNSPGARSSHACASQGDVMIIWGGEDSTGYLNDLYQFGANVNSWNQIIPSGTIPTARIGACIAMNLPYFYIFGGLTNVGFSSELWKYDTSINAYTLLPTSFQDTIPTPAMYSSCEISDNYFILMAGVGSANTPLGYIFQYDLVAFSWTQLIQTDLTNFTRSFAAVKYFDGKVIFFGGEAWSLYTFSDSFVIDLATGSREIVAELSEILYAGGFTYFQTQLYVFGGGTAIQQTMRFSNPSYNFYSYDIRDIPYNNLASCSPGSYQDGADCPVCYFGTYSINYSASNCSICPVGTFNSYTGASTESQCYPCAQGSYAPSEGSKLCIDCPHGSYCPVKSSNTNSNQIFPISSSSQPINYSPDLVTLNNDKAILYGAIAFFFLLISLFIYFNRWFRSILHNLDLYKAGHNFQIDKVMYLRKNKIGGIFSLTFLLVAILLIVSAILQYELNNTIESKTLVPLVILENKNIPFVGNIEITSAFYNYGGNCVENGTILANITQGKLAFKSLDYSGNLYDSVCTVTAICRGCIISTGAYISYSFQEKLSYSSVIGVNITSTSSIPNQYSNISETVVSSSNTVFRGFGATKFNFLVTPSLYEDVANSIVYTGYHMSINSQPVPGTQEFTSK